MKRTEWIGHASARRKLTEDGWLYQDADTQAFAVRGLLHGVDLPTIDAFIEGLEAEGAGAGAELRERRHKAWESRSDQQIFFRHMEWIVVRHNEILGKKALLGEIKRLKREATVKPPPELQPPTRHKLRTNSLDAPIKKAIKQAESLDTGAVFLELRELAITEEKPFTGKVEGDALFYTNDNGMEAKITKDLLRKRLKNHVLPEFSGR